MNHDTTQDLLDKIQPTQDLLDKIQSTQDLLDKIQRAREQLSPEHTRELVLANDAENCARTSTRAREVYKDIKIKRLKDVSRSSEDTEAKTSSSLGQNPQKAFDNVITPASTSSRVTGVSVQHVKTKMGIKLNVTIQTESDARAGTYVELTAELKRHSRLRELKRYASDDADFEQIYVSTIESLKTLTPEQGKNVCIGRLHVRGARGHWFANMMVLGKLTDAGVLETVLLHVNGDEFDIELTGSLSPKQAELYYNTGIYGVLTRNKPAPRLETAVRKIFK